MTSDLSYTLAGPQRITVCCTGTALLRSHSALIQRSSQIIVGVSNGGKVTPCYVFAIVVSKQYQNRFRSKCFLENCELLAMALLTRAAQFLG